MKINANINIITIWENSIMIILILSLLYYSALNGIE